MNAAHGRVWEDTFPLRERMGVIVGFVPCHPIPIRPEKFNCGSAQIQTLPNCKSAGGAGKLAQELEKRVAERTSSSQRHRQMEEFSTASHMILRAPVRAMQGYAQATLEDYGDNLERGAST